MKPSSFLHSIGLAGALLASLTGSLRGEEASDASTSATPKSVFDDALPNGRDPFHPKSTRREVVATPTNSAPVLGSGSFVLNGISGVANNRLVVINQRTLGVGESVEVITPSGRVRIQCLEIGDNRATIQFGNPPQRVELFLTDRSRVR